MKNLDYKLIGSELAKASAGRILVGVLLTAIVKIKKK